MTPSETTRIMAMLQNAYPREEVSPDRLRLYCELLADLEHDQAVAAVRRVLAKSKWWPSIAEIREEYAGAAVDLVPAEVAWGEVLEQVRRCGRYKQPAWSSPQLEQAVAAIGWEAICTSQVGDSAIRAQFREAYRAMADRARMDVQTPAIARTDKQRQRLGQAAELGKLLLVGGGK